MNPEVLAAIQAEQARLEALDASELEAVREQARASGLSAEVAPVIERLALDRQMRRQQMLMDFAAQLRPGGAPVPNEPMGGVAKGPYSARNLDVSQGIAKGPYSSRSVPVDPPPAQAAPAAPPSSVPNASKAPLSPATVYQQGTAGWLAPVASNPGVQGTVRRQSQAELARRIQQEREDAERRRRYHADRTGSDL